jgi:hypothetical protein
MRRFWIDYSAGGNVEGVLHLASGCRRPGVPGAIGRTAWIRGRGVRLICLLALVAFTLPVTAFAQWSMTKTEHDWQLSIGGYSFGLVQKAHYFTSRDVPTYRQTTICLGPLGSATTRLQAPYIAAALILLVAAGVAFPAMSRLRGKEES